MPFLSSGSVDFNDLSKVWQPDQPLPFKAARPPGAGQGDQRGAGAGGCKIRNRRPLRWRQSEDVSLKLGKLVEVNLISEMVLVRREVAGAGFLNRLLS